MIIFVNYLNKKDILKVKNNGHYYYCCSNRLKAKCEKGYEKKEELENSILTLTSDFVLTEKNILFLSKKIYDYFNSSDIKLKIKDYENKINKLNKELDKCLSLMLKTTSDEILTRLDTQTKEYSIQKKDIESEVNKLKLATNITKTEKEVKDYLKFFIKKGKENKSLIFDSFINSIWVYDKKTIVFYNLFDKKPPINFVEFKNYIKENGISIDTSFLDKKKGVLILTPMAGQWVLCTHAKLLL